MSACSHSKQIDKSSDKWVSCELPEGHQGEHYSADRTAVPVTWGDGKQQEAREHEGVTLADEMEAIADSVLLDLGIPPENSIARPIVMKGLQSLARLAQQAMAEKAAQLVAKWRKIIAECPVEHEKRWRDVFEAVETCASELEAAAREPGASERSL